MFYIAGQHLFCARLGLAALDVNGKEATEPRMLQVGDRIMLGHTSLEVTNKSAARRTERSDVIWVVDIYGLCVPVRKRGLTLGSADFDEVQISQWRNSAVCASLMGASIEINIRFASTVIKHGQETSHSGPTIENARSPIGVRMHNQLAMFRPVTAEGRPATVRRRRLPNSVRLRPQGQSGGRVSIGFGNGVAVDMYIEGVLFDFFAEILKGDPRNNESADPASHWTTKEWLVRHQWKPRSENSSADQWLNQRVARLRKSLQQHGVDPSLLERRSEAIRFRVEKNANVVYG